MDYFLDFAGAKDWDMKWYPGDSTDIGKAAGIGAIAFGVYKALNMQADRHTSPSSVLKVKTEAIGYDNKMLEAFVVLQQYRKLNKSVYNGAIRAADDLMFLERSLITKKAIACENDKVLSTTHYRIAINNLCLFQKIVEDNLSDNPDHIITTHTFIDTICRCLDMHYQNILSLCDNYDPDVSIAKASQDVEKAMRRVKRRGGHSHSKDKWNKFKKAVERNRK